MMKYSNAWHLRDIILLTLIAIFFGVIYWVVGPLYNVLTVALTPIGLGPGANDVVMGIWVMAGPLAGYVFKKVGSATLGEFLGSIVEMFLGGAMGCQHHDFRRCSRNCIRAGLCTYRLQAL